MRVNEQDLEQLELYLDHELADADADRLHARLAQEPALSAELERLRGQRATRLSAMSTAFDTDADAVERLVASVRVAQASEALQRRRQRLGSFRSMVSAAACVAVGLLLGVSLQRQHGAGAGGIVAAPVTGPQTGAIFNNVGMGSGVYVVSLKDAEGREVMKVRFATQEQAQYFINHINNRKADQAPMHIGDARILNEPY